MMVDRVTRKRKRNRRGEGDYLKHEIVLGAYRLVKKLGWHAVSLRKIASEVGIAPQSIYLHFHSIEEIMQAVAVEGNKAILISIRKEPIVENDLREGLISIADGYLEFTRANLNVYLLMMSDEGRGEHSKETLRQILNMVLELVERHLPESATIPTSTKLEMIYTFWLGVHGIASADPPEKMRGVPGMTATKAVEYMADGLIVLLHQGHSPWRHGLNNDGTASV